MIDDNTNTFDDSVRCLLREVNRVLRELGPSHRLYQQLQDAAANVEEWQQSDDPRENGWVGNDGLP